MQVRRVLDKYIILLYCIIYLFLVFECMFSGAGAQYAENYLAYIWKQKESISYNRDMLFYLFRGKILVLFSKNYLFVANLFCFSWIRNIFEIIFRVHDMTHANQKKKFAQLLNASSFERLSFLRSPGSRDLNIDSNYYHYKQTHTHKNNNKRVSELISRFEFVLSFF